MACMDHSCTECEWRSIDNEDRDDCPKCGAPIVTIWDEEYED